jgi:hypothetical protein
LVDEVADGHDTDVPPLGELADGGLLAVVGMVDQVGDLCGQLGVAVGAALDAVGLAALEVLGY